MKWFASGDRKKIVKVLALTLLLRICSGSSMRSVFLGPAFIRTFDWKEGDKFFIEGEHVQLG